MGTNLEEENPGTRSFLTPLTNLEVLHRLGLLGQSSATKQQELFI